MNALSELEKWLCYISSFGDLEGDFPSIKIENCDNPGWWVKIEIRNTPFQKCPFEKVRINIKENGHPNSVKDWLYCYIEDDVFNGVGDPTKLNVIISIFIKWINENNFPEICKNSGTKTTK